MSNQSPTEITAFYHDLLEADGTFRVDQCSINLTVDQDNARMSALVEMQIVAECKLSRLQFCLSRTLRVSRTTSSSIITWQQSDNFITVVLNTALAPGDCISLTFDYEGPIRVRGECDQILCAIDRTGTLLTEWWFPWLRGLCTYFQVKLEIPDNLQAVANAPLVCHTNRYEWLSNRPQNDFEIAIGKYKINEKQSEDGFAIQCFIYEEDANLASALIETAISSLRLWKNKFGPSPWQQVQIVEIPTYYRGGRGPAPMLWLDPVMLKLDIKGRLGQIVAHELAHHWWSGLVRGKGPGGLLLQEGIATYCELLYIEEFKGKEAYHNAARRLTRRFHRRVKNQNQIPIVKLSMDHPLMYYLLYIKGAIIFYKLREAMGDSAFFDALRSFCQNCEAEPSTIEDFRAHIEHYGFDLKQFFRCALYDTGLPNRKLIRTLAQVSFRTQ